MPKSAVAPLPSATRRPQVKEEDGRRARGAAAREKMVRAARRILDTQKRIPTAYEVASDAGVSLRNVYHHFGSVETLVKHALALPPRKKFVQKIVIEPAESWRLAEPIGR